MRIQVASKNSQNAMTLVEVIVAVCILGVMAGGIMGSISYGFYVMQSVRENQRATQILLEKAELIRLYNWDQVTSSGFVPPTFTAEYDPQAPTGSRGVTYHGTLKIDEFPGANTYRTNMRMFTIALRWNTGSQARERTVHTYVAKDGVQNYVY